MKKIILIFLVILVLLAAALFALDKAGYPVFGFIRKDVACIKPYERAVKVLKAMEFLRIRKDRQAEEILDGILVLEPDNIDALWGKAEIYRRRYNYAQAKVLLDKVLRTNLKYYPAMISMAYIEFRSGKFERAQKMIEGVLKEGCADQDTQALSYVLLGNICSTRSSKGNLLEKMRFTPYIKPYLDKAMEISPDLSEVHLGLGSFYLLAPSLIGGDLDKAIEELEKAYSLAPDFATVNVRLAQAYQLKNNVKKYEYHLKKAEEIEPDNETLVEFKKSK
ncbi:MAG: hypothetical protein WCY12_05680 [Candidatus Omnitrophota bacterium]